MANALPQCMIDSFLIANEQFKESGESSEYYACYIRLLYHLFGGISGSFEIHPQYHIPGLLHSPVDVVVMFIVADEKHPVLFIEIKPPTAFDHISTRQRADDQIRQRCRGFRDNELSAPNLFAISALGTRLAFYDCDTKDADPRREP